MDLRSTGEACEEINGKNNQKSNANPIANFFDGQKMIFEAYGVGGFFFQV